MFINLFLLVPGSAGSRKLVIGNSEFGICCTLGFTIFLLTLIYCLAINCIYQRTLRFVFRGSFGERLKADWEEDTCGAIIEAVDGVIQKKLAFLKPFKYGSFRLDYHLNKTIVVTENSIKAILNGRFDGDSAKLKVGFIWFRNNPLRSN